MEKENINIEESAKHFINFFGNHCLDVIKKCRERNNHIISIYNDDLFNKVEEMLFLNNIEKYD